MRLKDMLSRRKRQVPPLQKLTGLYNEIENDYLNNLSMQQNGRMKEALVGWQMLHDKLADNFSQLRNLYSDTALTKGESFLMDEITVIETKTNDWLSWLSTNYLQAVTKDSSSSDLQVSGTNPFDDSFSSTLREHSDVGQHHRSSSSVSGSSISTKGRRTRKKPPPETKSEQLSNQHTMGSSYVRNKSSPVVLTLRQASRPPNVVKKTHLLKSLRSISSENPRGAKGAPHSGPSTMKSDASTPAKYAANLIWSPTHSLKSSERSKSPGRSRQNSSDPFEGFDSSFVPTTKGVPVQQSTMAEQMKSLDLHPAPKYSTGHSTGSTTAYGRPRYSQVKKKQPSDRVKSALEKSAAVRLNLYPPQQVYHRHSMQKKSHANSVTAATAAVYANKGNGGLPSSVSSISKSKSLTNDSGKDKATQNQNRAKKPRKELLLSGQENPTKDTENLKELEDSPDEEEIQDNDRIVARNGTVMSKKKIIASLKGVDPTAARQILDEIVVNGDEVHWDDIAGLEEAKKSLKEAVVYPFLRPDLFSGLREPARGMLLFGPPGTGKTMLARAVATESQSTFFSISASSLTSKYLGESEKLVRALFQLAKKMAPSIIFVDEIDSLLGTRDSDGENEASRRIKNEFLVQVSNLTKAAAGKDTGEDVQRVLVLAATNLPWGIDEAARRRFVRRQYIPLPARNTRSAQFETLLKHQKHTLSEIDMLGLLDMTDGFSGSDITALAKDAAMGPLRELGDRLLMTNKSEIRPLKLKDFVNSLRYIKPSVSQRSLAKFEEWAKIYGSSGA